MTNKNTAETISFGINLITFGIIALFATLGLTSWQYILEFALTYWPLLIVIAGIKLVLTAITKNSVVSILFDFLIALAILAAIIVPAGKNVTSMLQSYTEKAEQEGPHKETVPLYPLTSVIQYQMTIGAAAFTLSDSTEKEAFHAESDNGVMTVTNTYNEVLSTHSVSFDNANAEIKLRPVLTTLKRVYTINTNTFTPATYFLKVGAASGKGTFTSAPISDFQLDLGAGDMSLTFANKATPKNLSVSVGAGACTIRIPKEQSVQLSYTVGAGEFRFNNESFGGLAKRGNYSYTGATNIPVNMTIQVGAGSVTVVTY